MAREDISVLGTFLRESVLEFLTPGEYQIAQIYEAVNIRWPDLCDDTFLCPHRQAHTNQPEWQHEVRRALDYLKQHSLGYIQKGVERGDWIIGGDSLIISEEESIVLTPERFQIETNRIKRNLSLARRLKILHENRCQVCGETIELRKNEIYYSEAHHLMPLGTPHNGPDIAENILVLCPNDHVRCDYRAIQLSLASLRIHPKHQISEKYLLFHNNLITTG